jgi:CheY-like chemotaxis protein
VNQKIATRTIGKLGFQVTAAWNGREALEYLVGSVQGEKPKPDIILMDVQMPIMDGYKTTHLMRHHLPYKSLVHDVPIVAMTASAIQGDREKCTKAGMDDYLPKPVTMNILERMLIRWSVARRRARPSPDPSHCSEHSEDCENADIPHVGLDERVAGDDPEPRKTRGKDDAAPQQGERTPFGSPVGRDLPSQVGRNEGEKEWTSKLQETKLMDAAGRGLTNLRGTSCHREERPGGDSLTEANVNKLKSENEQA